MHASRGPAKASSRPSSPPRPPAGGVNPPLLTRAQVAESLAICLRSVDNLVTSGDLCPLHFGRSVRFLPEDLEQLIESRLERAAPRPRRRSA